ncbi:MAG: sugar ABC transporter permease [Chloroflexi bacterium]|nr:MAG: sugar ABC transporter permease [Chloroflexota bacterium]
MGTAVKADAESAAATPSLEPALARRRPRPSRRGPGRRTLPYTLIAPAAIVIFGVLAYPLGMLAWISFQHYGLKELIAHQGDWVGLQNYTTLLADPLFLRVVLVSVVFTLVNVGLTLLFSTLIALLMSKVSRVIRVLLASGLIFVWATPVIVAVDIWQWMFDYEFGVVNYLLTQMRVFGSLIHHNWFENTLEGYAVFTVIVVWGAIPFVTITLFAALTQVPDEVVEAARVDGANPWQVFWGITAPLLKPIFLIVTSLSTIWDFQVFNQIYVLLNQRPSSNFFTIAIYSYRESFGVTQYGLGAAIAVVMVLVLIAVTYFYVRQTLQTVDLAT